MKQKEVAYLCDGNKECCSSKDCFVNGGTCKHTKDIEHAISFSHISDYFYGDQEITEKIEVYEESNRESEEIQKNQRLLNILVKETEKSTRIYKILCYFYIAFACIWIVLMIAKMFL